MEDVKNNYTRSRKWCKEDRKCGNYIEGAYCANKEACDFIHSINRTVEYAPCWIVRGSHLCKYPEKSNYNEL